MEACLEGLRSCGKGTTICKVASEACPEKSKAGSEKMEAIVEQQALFKKQLNFDIVWSLEDRYRERCLYGIAEGHRRGPETMLAPGRSCLPAGSN
jgi:hypothetical protein